MEPVEYDVMNRRPRSKDESIFARGVGVMALFQGAMIGILTLIAYFVGSRVFSLQGGAPNIPLGESMAFATLALSQLVHAFNVRSTHSILKSVSNEQIYARSVCRFAYTNALGIVLAAAAKHFRSYPNDRQPLGNCRCTFVCTFCYRRDFKSCYRHYKKI